MKTIDEIKDEIAQNHGYDSWTDYLITYPDLNELDERIDQAMQEYARVCCVEQSKNCKLAYQVNQEFEQSAWVAEQIENAKLATEL